MAHLGSKGPQFNTDVKIRDVDTHGTTGPQVQSRLATNVKSYARGFSARSNPKPGDPAELKSPT
jgi:hypothetical protein